MEQEKKKTVAKVVKTEKNEAYRISKVETIFGLAKLDGKVRITVGKYLASQKKFDTFEQAEKYISTKPYELLINTTLIINNYEKDK